MATITITNLEQLQFFGEKMKELAKKYESGVAQANNKFELKISGNEGLVIKEFVNKLNTIQSQVFESYPSYIETFGATMSNYESFMNGLGFDKEAWSQDGETGVEGVEQKLKNDQKTKIEDIQKKLDSYLLTASTILGQGKISVLSEYEKASNSLDAAASKRTSVDADMQAYYKLFISGLKTAKSNLDAIQNVLNHARYLGELDPSAVVQAIAAKRITSISQLDAIDAISDSGDGKVVEALYSPDPYNNLGQVNATHVSENMMTVVYGFIFTEVERIQEGKSDYSNIKTFLDALQNQDTSNVKIYTEKLIKGGDRYGLLLIGKAFEIKPEFPENGSVADYEKYKEELLKAEPELAKIRQKLFLANSLTGLFEGMNIFEVGTNRIPQSTGETVAYHLMDTSSLKLTTQGLTFKMQHYQVGSNGQVHVSSYDDARSVVGDEKAKEIDKLNERRNKAALDFLSNVMKMGASMAAGPYGPLVAMGITELSDTFTYKDGVSDHIEAVRNNKDYFSGKLAKPAGLTLDALHAVSKYIETSNEMTEQMTKSKTALEAALVDYGGRSITDTVRGDYSYKAVSFTPQYDLQSALQIHDMDRTGLKALTFHKALENGKSVEAALKDVEDSQEILKSIPSDSGPYTEEVKNYLRGKGGKTIDQVGITKVWEGLHGASNKDALMDSKGGYYTREQLASEYIDVYKKIAEGGFLPNEIPKDSQLPN